MWINSIQSLAIVISKCHKCRHLLWWSFKEDNISVINCNWQPFQNFFLELRRKKWNNLVHFIMVEVKGHCGQQVIVWNVVKRNNSKGLIHYSFESIATHLDSSETVKHSVKSYMHCDRWMSSYKMWQGIITFWLFYGLHVGFRYNLQCRKRMESCCWRVLVWGMSMLERRRL